MKLRIYGHQVTIPDALLKDEKMSEELREAIKVMISVGYEVETSHRQTRASKIATKARSDNARAKINNAINIIRAENRSINCNSVAVVSECSINTVRKYKQMIDAQEKERLDILKEKE